VDQAGLGSISSSSHGWGHKLLHQQQQQQQRGFEDDAAAAADAVAM
jgi:hypothetical protein